MNTKLFSTNIIVTDLLKALRDSSRRTVDCLGSGHMVPQQDDITVQTAIALSARVT
jgi:hypothetical protein